MRSATGRWVSGDDFFGRGSELQLLEEKVYDRNHVLLAGQRRMGKTSIARELGRRLETQGWVFLFTDVEGATCAKDVVSEIAQAAYRILPIWERLIATKWRRLVGNIKEISANYLPVNFRAELNAGNWRRQGEQLIGHCAEHDKPVLLVIDELPIFLNRMLRHDDGTERVEEFLSWLRSTFQHNEKHSPVLIVSGSIGLEPLVRRLGLSDRVNYLDPFRLGPWDREESIECFVTLARSCDLQLDDDVAPAVYEALGIGIPHHIQSFFARLREYATMQTRDQVTVEDVHEIYRTQMLGPSGQNDLAHYEARLKDGLDDDTYTIAKEILTEAATQQTFTTEVRRCLEREYSAKVADVRDRITEALDVLEHDGYLEAKDDGYRFPSRLLRDWWAARFRDHYTPLLERVSDND